MWSLGISSGKDGGGLPREVDLSKCLASGLELLIPAQQSSRRVWEGEPGEGEDQEIRTDKALVGIILGKESVV